MPHNQSNQLIEEFTRYRQELYNCFDSRQDTVIDLLDALARACLQSSFCEEFLQKTDFCTKEKT